MEKIADTETPCLSTLDIAMYHSDYKTTWYDVDSAEAKTYNFTVDIPANDGVIYFSAETWYHHVVSLRCM